MDSNSNQPADRPARLEDLKEADLRPWRDLPVSRLFLAHLREQQEAQLGLLADATERAEAHKATLAAGALSALRALGRALSPAPEVVATAEPEFIDPATIVQPGKRTP